MRTLVALCTAVLASTCLSPSHAEGVTGSLVFVVAGDVSSCRYAGIDFFWKARHPGGSHGLNESNHGTAVRCQRDEDSVYSWFVGGLENSQRGWTMVWGGGLRFSTPRVASVALHAGVDLTDIWYDSPLRQKTLHGVLPVTNVGASYELPGRYGELAFTRSRLGSTKIELLRLEWRKKFRGS